ncbi:site-specific recombinase XerD [Arthrobacter sp. UYEF6]
MADVNLFVVGKMSQWSTQSIRSAMSSLRVLFGWMFLTGVLDLDLAKGISSARKRPQSSVPKALPSRDIAAILAVETAARDRAILLLLARLGLRSCEVSRLCLGDFDWRAGTVQISGKRTDLQTMPLPAEVGEAITAYLQGRRTSAASGQQVFLTLNAPYRQLSSAAITTLVTKAAAKAEIPGRIGAHRLRHGAATGVLHAGGTLAEAGQLLRHRSRGVTAVYAKVGQSALVPVTRPWPGSPEKAGTR